MFDLFTPEARHAVLFAQRRSAARSASQIGVADLAHGALADGVWASALLHNAGLVTGDVVRGFILKPRTIFHDPKPPTDFTPEARKAIARSKKLAVRYGQMSITSAHLFVACLTVSDGDIDRIKEEQGLVPADLAEGLANSFGIEGS